MKNSYFATRLRELMKKAKVTQQDLATAVGTTRQAISQYADGSVQPNIEKLYKIAEFFNVSSDYLLGLENKYLNETCKKINEAQAKEFAFAFLSAIPSYIENHKAEYLAYLEETGQMDKYYQNKKEK